MSTSPAMHVVVQVTRVTGLGAGINPTGLPEGGRIFFGPDDQTGVTVELDSLEAASRLLAEVQSVVDDLRERRRGPLPAPSDEPLVLHRPATPGVYRRALELVGRS